MSLTPENNKFLETLSKKIIIYDGAMGTSLQSLNLTAADFGGEKTYGCNDFLSITCPQAVESVHRSFLQVGADVIETNTFRANRLTLRDYGLQDRAVEINKASAALARRLADEFSSASHLRFVAGSMGPTGKLPSMDDPEMSDISFNELADIFREQAIGLIQGGVHILLVETSQDILEVKAALLGIQQAFAETRTSLPIQVQVTLDTTGRMLLGTDIAAVLATLEGFPIHVIGLNCSTGPDYMREPIRYLGENSPLPVSCIPNAGLPINVDGKAVYPMEAEPFAKVLTEFVKKYNINIVGGCCGTKPEHIKRLVEELHDHAPLPRPKGLPPRLSSSIEAVFMQQEPPPFLIGERLNTQGSKKFKELILEENFENILSIAMDQVSKGAHGLDLCVALTERSDEAATIHKVIKKLAPVINLPLIIDTTELDVMETALQTAPGRCLINSTNLESGTTKAEKVFRLAQKYNAAVMALTIDEQGMAKTAQRKLEIARRIFDLAVNQVGLRPSDLVIDALTFTLSTGDPEYAESAMETMQGIRLIKSELPGVLTSLGISNVSFGMSPSSRALLNSVMLYHCVQAGLDMAIVNPAQITPYADLDSTERRLADDLIFNRHPEALQNLIAYFHQSGKSPKTSQDDNQTTLKNMAAEERIRWRILHRHKEGIEQDIDEILIKDPARKKHDVAIEILNTILLPAMKEVGDKFGAGELILPFVLQSAEVMKKSVNHLEKYLDRTEGVSKGLVVLATVYGDVHDIGKNLVKTILSNNGYQVFDIGKQVPMETIISKAVEYNADAIGLSALLVSTSKQMPLIVNELQRRGMKFPVLIGGAAINPRFGRRILFTDSNVFYEPGVFYCKDAFEGLSTMDDLMVEEKRPALLQKIRQEAEYELNRAAESKDNADKSSRRTSVTPAPVIPSPPGWGVRVVREMPLDAVWQHISKKELFRLSWGAKHAQGKEWKEIEAAFERRLDDMRRKALQDPWLFPQGVYGYFPCQSDGNDLIVYQPQTLSSGSPVPYITLHFPRQIKGEYLCLADYFSPINSGTMDMVAFQVVTVGYGATQKFEELQNAHNYSEAYYTHGLAVQVAEAAADFLHAHIRKEIGIPPNQGKRYSWGFPAIPNIEEHAKIFQLLPAEKELGMKLTSAYQLVPEQSTAAIIVHHPQAKYYDIGETRYEQLVKNATKGDTK